MKILIDEMLKGQGKTLYWLRDQTGLSYPTIWNLTNGRNKMVSFETLDLICAALDCKIEDILEAEK